MNKRHPYNDIIERKLEQLPPVNADHLWNDMHSILDKKMPQKKESRRFIAWWFFSGKGLLLLTDVFLIITVCSFFFLSTKESSTVTKESSAVAIKNLPGSPSSNKFIEDGAAKVSRETKENITTAGISDQIKKDKSSATITTENVSATTASLSVVENVVNNNPITKQTTEQFKKSTAKEQFNQPIQDISNPRENIDIAPVNLKSIHHGLVIGTNDKEEKKYVSQQLEPIANKVRMNPRNNNENGFYTGFISGVDISSIHFRSAKTGTTAGLIIGYAFNKKWSIESGLLWDTKRVYDNGRYFNPPGYTPTNGITIVAVNGKSRLYEWPVNMKYTIVSGKNSLFATTGLSSYFMKSENYDYEYEQNGQPGGHNYLSYKNESKDWFSVVNFSIGYTHKLGYIGSIRVEPYLKLPIKNLGIGNMPIMSTGLNIGFTKPLR